MTPPANNPPGDGNPARRMRGFSGTPVDASPAPEPAAAPAASRKAPRWFAESSAALSPAAVVPAAAGMVLPAPPLGRSTPAAKRPKGRLFVGGILVCILGAGGYGIWSSFLR